MSETGVHEVHEEFATDPHAPAEHAHPSDLAYIKVALVLFVITAAEVATYYANIKGLALIAILTPMMIAKFAIVAAWFMHLRFDSHIYRRFFITGIVLAVIVYTIVLFTFHVFAD
ncbi:MAG TPA: cytochrome C oxidase subunit IV family protein [Acidimicrobiales bacterium]|jgi:cytochrome c oxidase subunit 4